MTAAILEVENLCTVFSSEGKSVPAVDGISFDLNLGETVGIVGESGSGKSVTSLSIMRLIPPPGNISSGSIHFIGKNEQPVNLLSLPEKEMRTYRGKEIAMIFQEPMTSLNPVFTCGSQVTEAITLHLRESKKEAKDRTLALFDKVKLSDPNRIFSAYPHQLSGGQKQRVMIAMAISCNPTILIADEPTTALDVTVQARILELMDELHEEYEMSMIFITHDLGVVAEVADKVLVMYKGKIVEQGTMEEIFTQPKHPYTRGLLACRPPLKKRLRRLPVISDFWNEEELPGTGKEVKSVNEMIAGQIVSAKETENRLQQIMKQQPILEVRNLVTWFPSRKNVFGKVLSEIKAVDDVSFDVYQGETLGLVGESGCGKTTLGRSILQLVKPTSGQVLFEQKDLVTMDQEELRKMRRHIQIIFQDPYSSLNPRLTAGYAIVEPMRVHQIFETEKQCRERVFELLDKVNMPKEAFNRFPHEFSGGQRQRICIARALALNPKFIICDESVSALDVSVQAQVLNLLLQLREEMKFTCIFISHDLSVVKFMSDRMIVMNNGKIEEQGPSDSVCNHPASDYTRRLIQSVPQGDLDVIRNRRKQRSHAMN